MREISGIWRILLLVGASGALAACGASSRPSGGVAQTPVPEGPGDASPTPVAAISAPSAPASEPADIGPAPDATAEPEASPDPEPMPIPKNTAVLHFGDSMVFAGFNQAISPRFRELGVRFAVRSDTGSSTVHWSPKIGQLVADTQPDLVIINLGGNEIAHQDPEALVPVVRHIVKSIGGRPCVWVSPPLWRQETGILEVIREHSAPCRFFDSNALVPGPIERKADGIHPNLEGGARWADVFWQWLMDERRGVDSPWELRAAPPGEHQRRSGDGAVATRSAADSR